MLKKMLLAWLLVVGSGAVMAEWVKIGHTDQSVFYLDSSRLKKVEGHVMVWVLRDHGGYRFGPSGAFQSSKDQFEVDCPGMRIRRLYSSDHPQAMGEGKMVHYEHGPMSWNRVAPNTLVSRIVEVACLRP